MYSKLKEVREQKGYNLKDMGRVINKSAPNYLKKENGDVKFSVNEALLISRFLKLKVETLFFENQVSVTEKGE